MFAYFCTVKTSVSEIETIVDPLCMGTHTVFLCTLCVLYVREIC
eukprot:SAG11_NODE_28237_length_324_cov_0.613333_1_plen_43_part_01